MTSSNPAPGWYDDPQEASQLRFWDGHEWTQQTMARESLTEPTRATQKPEGFRNRFKARLEQDREQRERERLLSEANSLRVRTEQQRALEGKLSYVEAAARRGAIAEEEAARADMLSSARSMGGGKLEKYAESMLEQAQSEGRVRINCSFIGVVKAEGFFTQYARKESLSKVSTGSSITVFSDRLFHGKSVYIIDAFTQAQVFLDGAEQITQRPTLTRMVLFSPLPGTALIPGLALQKKKKNDMRHAEFVVGSQEWSINTPVNPDALQEPRRIAQMINSTADALAQSMARSDSGYPVNEQGETDLLSQLERLGNLRNQGLLSESEFEIMKSAILSQEGK